MSHFIQHQLPRPGFRGGLALLIWGALAGPLFGFVSLQKEQVAAFVSVGYPEKPIIILHDPLKRISPVTFEAIIQGEAGSEPSSDQVPFPGRTTDALIKTAGEEALIRVTLYYRLIDFQNSSEDTPFSELPPITGPDPVAFAFQIPSSALSYGTLQYKIMGEKLRDDGSGPMVVSIGWYPEEAMTSTNVVVSVGVEAGANDVIGAAGGRIVIDNGNPNVGRTALDIPAGLFSELTTVSLDELSPTDPQVPPFGGITGPFSLYRFDTERQVRGLMNLTVLYPAFSFPNGVTDNFTLNSSETQIPKTKAAIAWWDGFAWRVVGGQNALQSNEVSARISRPGIYAVIAAASQSPRQRAPREKIITPNGDGANDTALFELGDVTENVKIEIYDVSGRRIRTIMSAEIMEWDGRDEGGKIVESGVYIYQYSLQGERISGLIAVAK